MVCCLLLVVVIVVVVCCLLFQDLGAWTNVLSRPGRQCGACSAAGNSYNVAVLATMRLPRFVKSDLHVHSRHDFSRGWTLLRHDIAAALKQAGPVANRA